MKNKENLDKIIRVLEGKEDIKEIKQIIKEESISMEDLGIIMDVIRELRLNDFFNEDLDVNNDKLNEILEKEIELHPKSVEYPLFSTLYKDHKGKYKVQDLFNEYHDSVIRAGTIYGIQYGKKFIIEDLQNGKLTIEEIKKTDVDDIIKRYIPSTETI